MQGDDVVLENVHVAPGSCLEVYAAPGAGRVHLKGLNVQNKGWEFVALSQEERATASEELLIRGSM